MTALGCSIRGVMSETALTRFLAEQTVARLREMRSELRDEIEQTRNRTEELEADLRRIETAISERPRGRKGAAARPGGPAAKPAPAGTSMKDTILSIMAERPLEAWTTQDVLDELERRSAAPGGAKPLNTVGNRLVDLAKAKKIHRVAPGTYSLTAPGPNLLSDREGG